MTQPVDKNELIAKLQSQIGALQGMRAGAGEPVCLGLGVIEAAFPGKTLPVAAVHEFISYGREEAAATNSFIACMLGRLLQKEGYCIWVATRKNIYTPALKRFGIDAGRILFINADKNINALWAIEEALKCNQIMAVVGEVPDLSFTESRRLQLAVENSKATGLIHRCYPRQENTVACISRWHIKPMSSITEAGMPGVGFPRWKVDISKIKNGRPGKWIVEWSGADFVISTETRMPDTGILQTGMYG